MKLKNKEYGIFLYKMTKEKSSQEQIKKETKRNSKKMGLPVNFKSLSETIKIKRTRYFYKKGVRADKHFKEFVKDVEYDIALGCFDKLCPEWQHTYSIPNNLDKKLVRKEVQRKCNSSFINNGCKILVVDGTSRDIDIYIKV